MATMLQNIWSAAWFFQPRKQNSGVKITPLLFFFCLFDFQRPDGAVSFSGICFELNGSFGYLLSALGYKVTDYAARYLRGESTIPMRRHRVMKVEATDGVWLCDVGIGEVAQREPVALVEGLVQEQFGETYKLLKEEDLGWVLWDLHKGQWRKFYSFMEEKSSAK